jgi:hypothetical protein
MNCVEFERVLLEGVNTPEQQAHLNSCSACASLQSDLGLISSHAKLLLAADEPSPAVWNALELQLRREGLIRRPEPVRESFDFFRRWRTAWLVPVAAALLIVAGLRLHRPAGAGDNAPIAKAPAKAPVTAAVSGDDQQLLDTVASRPPAQRARYRAELDDANAFIRDAEAAAKSDPNDVFRQQMLINAYEQKEMLYDLAVNRVAEQ